MLPRFRVRAAAAYEQGQQKLQKPGSAAVPRSPHKLPPGAKQFR